MSINSNYYKDKLNRRKEEKFGRIYNALIQYCERNYWTNGIQSFIEKLLKRELGVIYYGIFEGADNSDDIAVKLLRSCKNVEIFCFLLLASGADFTHKDEQGRTMVHTLLVNEAFCGMSYQMRAHPSEYIDAMLCVQVELKNTSNPSDNNGITHFHAACKENFVFAVEFFLNNGVNVNEAVNKDSPNFSGFTGLHFAVEYERPNVIEILLKHGANIHLTNGAGLSPLHNVVKAKLEKHLLYVDRAGVKKMYDMILKNFINVATNEANDIQTVADDVGFCHLHAACILQDESLVENVLEKIGNVNRAVNFDSPICPGFTPLHFAVFCDFRIFELLLKKGADFRVKNARGLTAFDLACLRNEHNPQQMHSVISMIDEWQSIVLSDNQTKLLDVVSAMESKDKFVTFLNDRKTIDLSVFVPLNATLWPGYTVLHLAVVLRPEVDASFPQRLNSKYDNSIIEECLEREANVTIKDAEGSTPIHLAFYKQIYDVVRLLLDHHYEHTKNPADKNNLSHFHIACALGHQKTVEHFLSNGVDVNSSGPTTITPIKTRYRAHSFIPANSTALHFSVCPEDSRGMIEKLLEHGADVNAKNAIGFTPVHQLRFFKYARENAHDVFLSDKRLENSTTLYYGRLTHLHVACYYNHFSSIEKLLKNGADVNATLTPQSQSSYERDSYEKSEYYYDFSAPRDDNDFLVSDFRQKIVIGSTPLDILWPHNKYTEQHVKIIFMMIEHNVDISARINKGTSPLERLLSLPDYLDECYKTFNENITVKTRLEKELGITELHLACCLANCQLVEKLIGKGINLNSRVNNDSPIWRGYTPLHCTVHRAVEIINDEKNFDYCFIDQLSEIVRLLTKHGADLLLKDEEGANTPLHLINLDCNADKLRKVTVFVSKVFENLSDFNVNPMNLQGISLFHIACATQHEATIEKFLKQGNVDVNRPISYFSKICPGSTALHLLIKYHLSREDETLVRMLDMLLDNRANVNLQDAFGNTPLLEAIKMSGSIRGILIKKLMSIGADVHVENVSGIRAFELLLATSDEATWEEIEVFLNAG